MLIVDVFSLSWKRRWKCFDENYKDEAQFPNRLHRKTGNLRNKTSSLFFPISEFNMFSSFTSSVGIETCSWITTVNLFSSGSAINRVSRPRSRNTHLSHEYSGASSSRSSNVSKVHAHLGEPLRRSF